MKKFALCILTALVFTTSVAGYSEELSEDLANGIVRLHVIADSDSKEDQEVKLKVRDAVLKVMEEVGEAEEIEGKLHCLEETANNVLADNGFLYKAKAEFGEFYFPTKYYDGFALPKGDYTAVRIKLGKGEGANWWCVMFPPLCMVDKATGEQEALLRETFGENYSVVTGEGVKFNIKFKLAELF